MMINETIKYMDFLITLADPKKVIFIAVDGVAPLAKVNQQRRRRFKAVKENAMKSEIKLRYGKKENNCWSNTSISTGTRFMEKLHQTIINHFTKHKYSQRIIYSSYHTPGEGEHKILEHIRKNDFDTQVIYGLDADLILLSLASQKKNIYLLRESNQFGIHCAESEKDMTFVSIDNIAISIVKQLKPILRNEKNLFTRC